VLNGKTLVIIVDSETATAHMFWGQVSVVHDPDSETMYMMKRVHCHARARSSMLVPCKIPCLALQSHVFCTQILDRHRLHYHLHNTHHDT
jgi:hypothetical protein